MNEQPQTYYAVTHADAVQAMDALWAADDASGRARASISFFFVGLHGWIWATDPVRHARLAGCLDRLGLPYTVTTERGTHPFVEPVL